MAPVYLDTSAICKLVLREEETDALLWCLAERPERVSSILSKVETHRAVRRAGGRESARRADAVLERIALLNLDSGIVERASAMLPVYLRSLDAIHLASALAIPALVEFICYDRRLADAAHAAGLRVLAPA